MKRRIYEITPGIDATIAPALEMVHCYWCGIAITPENPRIPYSTPDDVITLGRDKICARCGRERGTVTVRIIDAP